MTGKLLAQLAWVACRDAEAIHDSYAYPPRTPLARDEFEEAERLQRIADDLFEKAEKAGVAGEATGLDALFGAHK